ncbi:DNA polymerase III subunit delta [Mycoplasma corogypsi]|uniref:DNA polymerase III subunit delta n=1 Tax=Mycoplasma corogypsi TaxID=2106 RepID=UPI00387320B2
MYLLIGDENYFINQNLDQLKSKFDDNLIVTFSDEYSFNDIINTINNVSLFEAPKLYIFNMPKFFTQKTYSAKEKQVIKAWIDAMKQNKANQYVVVVNSLLNPTHHIVKVLSEANFEIINCSKIASKDLPNQIMKYVSKKDGHISYIDANYLVQNLPDDLTIIINEIDKMMLTNKNITKVDIDNISDGYNVNDKFGIINAIKKKDFELTYKLVLQALKEGLSTTAILSNFSYVFTMANNVYKLTQCNLLIQDICSILSIKEYPYKTALGVIKIYGPEKVVQILKLIRNAYNQLIYSEIKDESLITSLVIDIFNL